MIHFCFVNPGFLYDPKLPAVVGPLVQMYLIGREIVRRGGRVTYICLSTSRSAPETAEHDGITVHYLPVRNLPMRWSEPASFAGIERLLDQARPDAIYTRGRSSLPHVAGRWARRNGAVAIWNAARDRDFDGDRYVRMKTAKLRFPKRLVAGFSYNYIMNDLFERGVRASGVTIVQHEDQVRQFADRFGTEPIVIPSAVEIPERMPEKGEEVEVTWIAGIKGEKRPELFLELARRLADTPVRFTMGGTLMDSRFGAEIENTLRANPRFSYLGPIPYERTAEFYGRASLFVNTSRPGIEGFPNAYLQAWAGGTPVLSLDCDPGGVIERNGLGALAPDVDRMVEAVLDLVGDPGRLDQTRERCRQYVLARHSPTAHVDKLLDAIERARA